MLDEKLFKIKANSFASLLENDNGQIWNPKHVRNDITNTEFKNSLGINCFKYFSIVKNTVFLSFVTNAI